MKRILLAVVGCIVVIALAVGVLWQTRPVVPEKTTTQSRSTTSGLDAVRDALRKGADLEACRTAVQQLNAYLSRNANEGAPALTEAQQKVLTEKFHLDSGELTEVSSRVFTPLDANYLETCFLIMDSIRAMKIEDDSKLEQMQAAFAWIIREVRLREQDQLLLPPRFVLGRSWGSSLERAAIFSAVADLLGVDSCMVAVPYSAQDQPGVRYWIPGALIDGKIYLFDTRMGMPIPGPDGKGVATLAQARSQPAILSALTVKSDLPYDVNAEMLKGAEVHVAGSLSMLAPRMRYLQDLMSPSDKVNIYVDPEALLQRFQKALEAPELKGVTLHVWNHPAELKTPFRALRLFLPLEDGGVDKSSPSLRQQARIQLIPWSLLPPEIAKMPGDIGARLRSVYADPFYTFYVETKVTKAQIQTWMPGLVNAPTRGATSQSEEGPAKSKEAENVLRGRLPRELMLRGRYDEASNILSTMEGELRRQLQEMRAEPDLLAAVRSWGSQAIDFIGAVIRARDAAAAGKGGQAVLDPEEVRQREIKLMEDARPVMVLIHGTAAGPLMGDVTYFLALCKQEQAERQQVRIDYQSSRSKTAKSNELKSAQKAWESAAGWWNTYLTSDAPLGTPGAARANLARARICLGDQSGARNLLEDLSGELTPLEKTGRLYQAKQIK